MGQMTDAQLETQHFQWFCDWYIDYVKHMSNKIFTKSQICFSFLLLNLINLDSMFLFIMLAGRSFGRLTEDGNGGETDHAF
jgi:hypothetical protein